METRVTDQPAFILRRRDWQNSSLLLDLFTRDHGRIRVLARGARRNPAKQAYQSFELLSVGWSGRQELKTLTAIEASALAVDERNYIALLYVNELIGALLPEREANRFVFDRYLALLQLGAGIVDEAELRRFELDLVTDLGYFPDIGADAVSGQSIDDGSWYQFVINQGFVRCDEAARDAVSGSVIRAWTGGDYADAGVLRLARVVLRSTIDFNLHGKKLKSREVYQQMMRRK